MICGCTPASFRRPRALLILVCFSVSLLSFLRCFSTLGTRPFDIRRELPYIEPLDDKIRNSEFPISPDARCANFPRGIFDKIQIVVKIGAPEARSRLAAQLVYNAACVQDLLIFSDYEEQLGQHHIHDALANLRPSEWAGNVDRDIYTQIQTAKDAGDHLLRSTQGWKLDKYKFLPMMDMTWQMRSHKDWFVFIEADTYVFWDNLFRWLAHLNPETALYMGSPVWSERTFAHGGSGIILSRHGLQKLVRPRGYDCKVAGCTQYGFDLDSRCCGDEVLADALRTRGISLTGFWPMINGEKPATVRYGREEQWCEPIISMHHVNETDQAEMWNWEMRRASRSPVTFEDLWQSQEHLISSRRTHWTVLPEGSVLNARDGHASAAFAEACERACLQKKWCYQWQHTIGSCELSRSIRVGREQLPDKHGSLCISGTIMHRIAKFKQRMGHCEDAHWVRPNPR
ncbi:hypothetical protein ANO11243_052390 [Dothideomycetidae sp. 11243]|nr:hypothetical protein ANO11243_052390 [fungal sp. No.11243]